MNELKKVETLSTTGIFTKRICKAIPLVFDNSLSYYEALCALTNYLENEVIPAVNNNGEAVEELQALYVQLKNYVDNYFTNLDVQEEINNKLDEMAESGELEEIIINYFKNLNVTYSQFGAKGDGITDDFEAIKNTHLYANENNVAVIGEPNKTYYVKNIESTIPIETNTNWNHCNFIIDDRDLPKNIPLFNIKSKKESIDLTGSILNLKKGDTKTTIVGKGYLILDIINSNKKDYIRKGENEDNGSDREEIVRVNNNGYILDEIFFDFDEITKITGYPIDEDSLFVKNGNFKTIANTLNQKNSISRNILITRSNTIIDNINHEISGETQTGCPYSSFLHTMLNFNVIIKNCKLSGHKIYEYDNVKIGSYDIYNEKSLYIYLDNIQQKNSITDNNIWGIHTSSYCKNLYIKNSQLSRIDAHKGIFNIFIENCIFGWQSIQFVGGGICNVKNTKVINSSSFIRLREDYGATFNGKININNCSYLASNYGSIINALNDQSHDFGYECVFPILNIQNFKLINKDNILCHILYLSPQNTNINYNENYEFNKNNGIYLQIMSNEIILKNMESTNENNYFNLIYGSDIQNLYTIKKGNSLNKFTNDSIKNPNEYNMHINIDNCYFGTKNKINLNYNGARNSLWSAGVIETENFDFNNTHRPVIKLCIKNCDYLQLGNSGRAITYILKNCSIYLMRNGSKNSNHAYYILDKCLINYFYNETPSNNNSCFNIKYNMFYLTNCSFFIKSNYTLNDIFEYESPFNTFRYVNNWLYCQDVWKNSTYLNITDDEFKNIEFNSIINQYYGLNFSSIKNNINDLFIPRKYGDLGSVPVSNEKNIVPIGERYTVKADTIYNIYWNGEEWIKI